MALVKKIRSWEHSCENTLQEITCWKSKNSKVSIFIFSRPLLNVSKPFWHKFWQIFDRRLWTDFVPLKARFSRPLWTFESPYWRQFWTTFKTKILHVFHGLFYTVFQSSFDEKFDENFDEKFDENFDGILIENYTFFHGLF